MLLYDYPEYYDIAFSFRDIPREAAFISHCIEKHSDIPVRRILEIACGSAPHVEALAGLGYQYMGFDINRHMLDHGRSKWSDLTPSPVFIEADMADFDIETPCDFAMVMLGSLYLNSMMEVSCHLDCVSRALNDGALYFLDWCIQFSDPLQFNSGNVYTIQKDGIEIQSRFYIRLLDAIQNVYEETWMIDINDRGHRRTLSSTECNRAILPAEFLSLIHDRDDFQFLGWWRDWDLDKPIRDDEMEFVRPITIIRKTQPTSKNR